MLNVLGSIANCGTHYTAEVSPTLEPLVPTVIISEQWMEILKNKDQQKEKSNLEIGEISTSN